MQFYTAMRLSELQLNATTDMILTNIILREKSWT